LDPITSAKKASWNTACYCNSKSYEFKPFENGDFTPLIMDKIPSGQIYLAGPFFTFTQRWLVNQIYEVLKGMNLTVFSPWHDVGHGEASFVVALDLEGLDRSNLVFAILDGLDSGTLFETGYAIAKNIGVIGYVENESIEDVKMLVGSECYLESDLTTAIYKALWKLAK
jgi:nucleoside 2-deoxyribosyltransferase